MSQPCQKKQIAFPDQTNLVQPDDATLILMVRVEYDDVKLVVLVRNLCEREQKTNGYTNGNVGLRLTWKSCCKVLPHKQIAFLNDLLLYFDEGNQFPMDLGFKVR